MTIFGREPAVVIGVIVTIILGAVATLTGNGFISEATQGKLTDAVNAIAQLAVLVAPIITGILIRPRVSPVPPADPTVTVAS